MNRVQNDDPVLIVADITNLLQSLLTPDLSLGAKLKFDYGAAGIVFIDGTKAPNQVHNRDEAADCTVTIAPVVHQKMLLRELDQRTAFTQGKMKISGDIAVAVRLGPLVFSKMDEQKQ